MNSDLRRLNFYNPLHLIAIGFGSGLVPFIPGTIGTLASIPFYLLISRLSISLYLFLLFLLFLLGIWACQSATDAIGVNDHGGIVWDEFVGYFITMATAPYGSKWIFIGFLLFRFFDILKPWPINVIDRQINGGFGIMLDDILAGIFALICMKCLFFII